MDSAAVAELLRLEWNHLFGALLLGTGKKAEGSGMNCVFACGSNSLGYSLLLPIFVWVISVCHQWCFTGRELYFLFLFFLKKYKRNRVCPCLRAPLRA